MTGPKIAYKYSSQRGLSIIEDLEVKITPPNQFNDPFEFTPHLICSNPSARAVRMLRNKGTLRATYEMKKAEGFFHGSFKDYQMRVKARGPEFVRELKDLIPIASPWTQNGFLDEISLTEGVLCLSSRNESIVMWGHYCDSHKGIVIGFNCSDPVFGDVKPVTYVTERVLFDASWGQKDPRAIAYGHQIVFSKNKDWEYEAELRQVFKLSGLKKKALSNGTTGYFLPLTPNAILSVFVGARSPTDFVKRVQVALRKPHFSHVELSRAALHESKYSLTLNRI